MSLMTCSAGAFPVPDFAGTVLRFCLIFAPLKGYDEPEILRSQSSHFGPISADAGHYLDAAQCRVGRGECLEAKHRMCTSLDPAVVLLDPVVEVFILPDPGRFEYSPRIGFQPALSVTGDDRLPVRLAAINDDTLGATMAG
jgi:hypothetical protein